MDLILLVTLSIFIPENYARSVVSADSKGLGLSERFINSIMDNGTREGDLICVDKLMMVEYTDFTEVTTCVHKTETMCHDTYVTKFVPHQERECEEKFQKTCSIHYDQVVQNEEVEVCNVQLVPDCEQQGPEECQLVYDTVCTNRRREHTVMEDVVTCNTVYEESCEREESSDTGELETSFLKLLFNKEFCRAGPRTSGTVHNHRAHSKRLHSLL